MQLNSIQVPSHTHPSPEICVLPQSRPLDSRLLSIQIMSHLNPARYICLWTASQSSQLVAQLHPGIIPNPSRFQYAHLAFIQVCSTKFRSQDSCLTFIHEPSPSMSVDLHFSSPRGRTLIPSRSPYSHLTSTQTPILKSELYTSRVSPQSRSWYLHLSFIQVTSRLHPCPENCISATPRSYLKPTLVSRCSFHLHLGPASPAFRSKDS